MLQQDDDDDDDEFCYMDLYYIGNNLLNVYYVPYDNYCIFPRILQQIFRQFLPSNLGGQLYHGFETTACKKTNESLYCVTACQCFYICYYIMRLLLANTDSLLWLDTAFNCYINQM